MPSVLEKRYDEVSARDDAAILDTFGEMIAAFSTVPVRGPHRDIQKPVGTMFALACAVRAISAARLTKSLWYTTYNRDLLSVDRRGATPFWRAAYALDLEAMRLSYSRSQTS